MLLRLVLPGAATVRFEWSRESNANIYSRWKWHASAMASRSLVVFCWPCCPGPMSRTLRPRLSVCVGGTTPPQPFLRPSGPVVGSFGPLIAPLVGPARSPGANSLSLAARSASRADAHRKRNCIICRTLFILPRKEREVPQNTTTLRPGRAGAVGRRNETPLAKFENALHKGNSGTREARKMHSIGFFRVKGEAVSRVKDARRIHCNT